MARGNGQAGRSRRWWVGGPVAVALLTSGVAVLWVHAPDLYASTPVEHGRAQAVALTRTGVLTAGAALLALAGVLANLLENRRATNLTHARELSEQLADRYTAAVAQLGSDTLDVRLGGLYALEQIAVDSEMHHRTAVEVLSAFVREHTIPGRPGASRRSRHTGALPTPAERAAGAEPHASAGLDTDIQAALTVLGRLPDRDGVPRADLTGAHLAGAQLAGADLSRGQLEGVHLTDAKLEGINLSHTQLAWADLTGAQMEGANLTGALLFEADLIGTDLEQANLTHAWLAMANLTGAEMNGAKLVGARMYQADATDARLFGADLTCAELVGATFTGTELGGADFTDARFLAPGQLDAARGNADTRLPEGLARPARWPEKDTDV